MNAAAATAFIAKYQRRARNCPASARNRATIPAAYQHVIDLRTVFSVPTVGHSEACAVESMPMAVRTWLGSRAPVVHALPELAAIPAMSSARSTLSPSTLRKQQLKLFESRRSGSVGPVITVSVIRSGSP
jgi:hypothetical protein